MNELEQRVKAVCAFAKRYQKADMSPLQLFRETGYSEHHRQITKEVISKELENNPDLIGDWYIWSENKRCTPAWFISKNEQDEWIVAFLEKNGRTSHTHAFSNALSATTFFVKMEMEQFRK